MFNQALTGEAAIYLSAVSLMEIGYLAEKSRIDINLEDIINLTKSNKNFILLDLDITIVKEAFNRIKDIPELHDRLIAASALSIDAALITNDPLISASKHVNTLWQ